MKDKDKTWQDIDDHAEKLKDAEFVKHDSGKPQLSLVPASAIVAIARVMEYGAKKYTRNNWRLSTAGDSERLRDAALRHLLQWNEAIEETDYTDSDFDSETGMPHLWHALCCLAFLIDLYCREGVEGYNPWETE